MNYWSNPYKRFSKYWWRQIRSDIRNFPSFLVDRTCAIFDWFPVMWGDCSWDNSFLYPLLLKKIQRMKKYGGLDWDTGRRWKALIICENLLKRLDADVYANYEDYDLLTHAQRRRRFDHEEYMRQQDLNYLFALMAKWSQTWWN